MKNPVTRAGFSPMLGRIDLESFVKTSLFLVICGSGILLSGCANMNVPDFDSMKFPDFREEAENIGDYPGAEDAPPTPNDLRTDAQWDAAARGVLAKRDGLKSAPPSAPNKSEDALQNEIQALDAQVEAYKLDDPQ